MNRYAVVVFLFCALINGTLLMGVGRLCGRPPTWVKVLLGSALIGIYACVCLCSGVFWINETICRILILLLVGWLSLGLSMKCIGLYILLSVGVERIVLCSDNNNGLLAVLLLALVIHLLTYAFSGVREGRFVTVELQFAGKRMRLTALRDNGNMLRDPITGMPVLILGLRASQELTGLNKQQLQRPVEVMRKLPIPGLRLIPYKTISEANGFILGLRMNSVRIDNWKGCLVVAFAPEDFGAKEEFEALTGGIA